MITINKLKYQNKSNEYITKKYSEYLHNLTVLNEILINLPLNTFLSRIATQADINKTEKKLDILRTEMIKRNLTKGE